LAIRSTGYKVELGTYRIGYVKLPGGDSDDGPIFLVKLDDLEGVLAPEPNVIVHLIEASESSKPWPGYVGNGAPIQAPEGSIEGVCHQGRKGSPHVLCLD